MSLEGYMLTGAFCAYFGSLYTGNPWIGLLCAAIGGGIVALLHAFITITVKANQIVTALGINMLALGFTSTQFRLSFGIDQVQTSCMGLAKLDLGFLSDIPVLGEILFQQNIMFYLLLVLIPILAFVLKRTSWGLAIHAAGEHPRALDVAGVNVLKVRYWSVIACGMLAGIGGGTMVLGNLNLFYDNVTAGRGYIAFAAIVFGRWAPVATALTTVMFGFFDALQLRLQSMSGNSLPYQIFVALPYIVTLLALLLVGSAKGPSASGKPYAREHKNL
jgi:ABC-type uncharacterized transport system permease subunit